MKHFIHSVVAAISGFVCLVSCTEQESDLLSVNQSSNNQLRVVTHTREGGEAVSSAASVYLFNDENAFVRILQTDASGAYVSAKLPEDTYTLYAYGGDLSHFQLPDDASISPSTAITLADNQDMGDLLMATSTVTLPDGTDKVVDLILQRKVLELSSITISQVPAGVTGVTVSFAPLYSAIQINGNYVTTDPVTATFTLTAASTAGVWEATPQQLVFPSKGVPTITVTFTRDNEDPSTYTYTADAALSANNKYDIAGTYTQPLGVTLSGGITFQPWATNPTAVNFDFDENNHVNNTTPDPNAGGNDDPSAGSGGSETTETPVAGQKYKGCYVVSVNESNHTAVLISPTERKEFNPDNNNWLGALNAALSTWEVEGVTGTWCIPTLSQFEELAVFPDAFNLDMGSYNNYFCLVGSDLKVVQIKRKVETAGGIIEVKSGQVSTGYDPGTYLKPFIEISY